MSEANITLGPQTPRFENPYSTAFIEHVRGRIHRECEALPVYVYDLPRAKWEYKNTAKRIIVECLTDGFPNRLNDPVVTNDWPDVHAMIDGDRKEFWIEASWCPETDALRGGIAIEVIKGRVRAAPPNASKRMIRGILGALKIGQKTLADPEDNLAPVGTPDGRPKSQHAVPESPKPAQRDPAPSAPSLGAPRQRAQATPQPPPEHNIQRPKSPAPTRRAEILKSGPAPKQPPPKGQKPRP